MRNNNDIDKEDWSLSIWMSLRMRSLKKWRELQKTPLTSSVLAGLHFNTKLLPIKFPIVQSTRGHPV